MYKIDFDKILEETGCDFVDVENLLYNVNRLLDYFQFHNKNLTKKQEDNIYILSRIVHNIKETED